MSRVDTEAIVIQLCGFSGSILIRRLRSRLRLLEASERHERLPQSSPCERRVRGLFQGMTQQPLGIVTPCQPRARAAARPHNAATWLGVFLEDLPKNPLGCLPIVGHEGSRCFLDALSLGIGEPCALEGNARVRILLEVDQRIAVGKPCEMMMRHFLQHPAHFLACLRSTSVAP